MRRSDVAQRVRLELVREFRCPASKVNEDAEFAADLGASSLDKIGIASALEDEFGVRLSDREVSFYETVGTAIDLVETKLENRSCGGGSRPAQRSRRAA